MKESTKRSIVRWVHILGGVTLIGYIYGPPEETRQYLPFFRYAYMPIVLLSGLWMWKGHLLRRRG